MVQALLGMEDEWTHVKGREFGVSYEVLVWELGVRPSHQALVVPGTGCSWLQIRFIGWFTPHKIVAKEPCYPG